MNPSQPPAPAHMTSDQAGQPQPSQEEVQAAIAREQQQHMGFLENRVLMLSVLNARLEGEVAELRAQLAARESA